jgi:large subunit ribosomal protein L15
MKFNELRTARIKAPKRVGRGIAAGQGKTAGRGTKGQKARTGSSIRPGFAGGSNPLMQQLPKLPGFRSHRTPFETVYTGQLEMLAKATVDTTALAEAGLISNAYVNVKLIQKGAVTKKLSIKLQGASQNAIAAIQEAGGSYEKTPRLGRSKTSTKNTDK